MKKALALLLSVLMLFGVSSCNKTENPDTAERIYRHKGLVLYKHR